LLINSGSRRFRSRPELLVATYPTPAAAGDFNNDGLDDLVIGTYGLSSGNITAFLNKGNGLLERRTSTLSQFPSVLLVGDFNNDGHLDALNLDLFFGFYSYQLLSGNGDGTFQELPSQTLPQGTAAAAADVNQDGKLDVVLLNSSTVEVLLGNGDGTFGPPIPFNAGQQSNSIVIDDFNRDGKLDVTCGGVDGVSFLRGNGDGSFQSPILSTGQTFFYLASGDLNGDGVPDLAGVSYKTVGVLFGNGNGTFQTEVAYTVPRYPGSVHTADINLDGKLDLVVAGYPYSLLLNNGDGSFGSEESYYFGIAGTSFAVHDFAIGDFNQDGLPDIAGAAQRHYSSTLGFLLSTGKQ
jgi:hypothetical protein